MRVVTLMRNKSKLEGLDDGPLTPLQPCELCWCVNLLFRRKCLPTGVDKFLFNLPCLFAKAIDWLRGVAPSPVATVQSPRMRGAMCSCRLVLAQVVWIFFRNLNNMKRSVSCYCWFMLNPLTPCQTSFTLNTHVESDHACIMMSTLLRWKWECWCKPSRWVRRYRICVLCFGLLLSSRPLMYTINNCSTVFCRLVSVKRPDEVNKDLLLRMKCETRLERVNLILKCNAYFL